MRTLAVLTAAVLAVLAAGAAGVPLLGAWVVPVAAVLSVSTNGLSYTAVAEHAGPFWAGRAFGIHNTAQNACAAIGPPAVAVVIGAADSDRLRRRRGATCGGRAARPGPDGPAPDRRCPPPAAAGSCRRGSGRGWSGR